MSTEFDMPGGMGATPAPPSGPGEAEETGLWRLPWGPAEGLLGLAAVVTGLILLVLALQAAGWAGEAALSRYALHGLQYAAFLAVPLLIARGCGGRPSDLGFRRAPARSVLAAIAAAPLFVAAMAAHALLLRAFFPGLLVLLEAETKAQAEALAGPWPLVLLLAVVAAPLAEEALFRGLVHGGLRSRFGPGAAGVLSSGFFAVAHQMPLAFPVLFLLGLGLARAYERRRSLALPVALHGAFNLISLMLGWSA